MKKVLIGLIALLIAVPSFAQCVAEVVDVVIDNQRGSIVVQTQYKLNDVVVDVKANADPDAIGRTRYTEETGTIAEIVTKAKADLQAHCENLIIRNAVAQSDLSAKQLELIKAKTTPLLQTLKTNAIGFKKTVTEKEITFKGKVINVKADGTYSVSDSE